MGWFSTQQLNSDENYAFLAVEHGWRTEVNRLFENNAIDFINLRNANNLTLIEVAMSKGFWDIANDIYTRKYSRLTNVRILGEETDTSDFPWIKATDNCSRLFERILSEEAPLGRCLGLFDTFARQRKFDLIDCLAKVINEHSIEEIIACINQNNFSFYEGGLTIEGLRSYPLRMCLRAGLDIQICKYIDNQYTREQLNTERDELEVNGDTYADTAIMHGIKSNNMEIASSVLEEGCKIHNGLRYVAERLAVNLFDYVIDNIPDDALLEDSLKAARSVAESNEKLFDFLRTRIAETGEALNMLIPSQLIELFKEAIKNQKDEDASGFNDAKLLDCVIELNNYILRRLNEKIDAA